MRGHSPPALAEKIDVEPFARLNDLWNVYAPFRDFETTLGELLRVHAQVGKLYLTGDAQTPGDSDFVEHDA